MIEIEKIKEIQKQVQEQFREHEKHINLLLIVIILFFLLLAFSNLVFTYLSPSFPSTKGIITSVSEDSFSIFSLTAPVKYEYTFSVDQEKISSTYTVHDRSRNPLRKLRRGSTVHVFYSHWSPESNTPAPGFLDVRYLGFLLLYAGIAFMIVAYRIRTEML